MIGREEESRDSRSVLVDCLNEASVDAPDSFQLLQSRGLSPVHAGSLSQLTGTQHCDQSQCAVFFFFFFPSGEAEIIPVQFVISGATFW